MVDGASSQRRAQQCLRLQAGCLSSNRTLLCRRSRCPLLQPPRYDTDCNSRRGRVRRAQARHDVVDSTALPIGCRPGPRRRVVGGRRRFDTGSHRSEDDRGMLLKFLAGRHFAFVMALAVALGPVATCLAAVVTAQPAPPPCHGTAQHHAPGGAAQLDCCPGEAPNTQSCIPGQHAFESSAPFPVLVAVLPALADPQVHTRAGIIDVGTRVPKPPGTATYVLVSSFRI